MLLSDLLSPERVLVDVRVSSRKKLLETLSETLAKNLEEVDQRMLFDSLCERERMGSTGLGHGVAIPHARLENLSEVRGCLLHLRQPVDFDAPDQEPVDLVFGLIVPDACTDAHLRILAQIARHMSSDEQRQAMRNAKDNTELYMLTREPEEPVNTVPKAAVN